MRDLLRNLEEAREIHVPVKELPDSLRSALKRVKYGSRDIGVVAQDKVEPNPYAAEGQKGFVLVIDIASGRSRDLEGSWGGASPNSPSEIDFANRPVPIPEGGAVIIGVQGYPQTMATIYVHPRTIAAMLPPAAETTEREQTILRTIRSLNSAGRKEVFGREKVTPAEIDALVARGLLSKTKAGAVSITTAGKNVAEGQEDGMRDLLRHLEESALEVDLLAMDEDEADALADAIDEVLDEGLTPEQRKAKADYKKDSSFRDNRKFTDTTADMRHFDRMSTKQIMQQLRKGHVPSNMKQAATLILRARIQKSRKTGKLKMRRPAGARPKPDPTAKKW